MFFYTSILPFYPGRVLLLDMKIYATQLGQIIYYFENVSSRKVSLLLLNFGVPGGSFVCENLNT